MLTKRGFQRNDVHLVYLKYPKVIISVRNLKKSRYQKQTLGEDCLNEQHQVFHKDKKVFKYPGDPANGKMVPTKLLNEVGVKVFVKVKCSLNAVRIIRF